MTLDLDLMRLSEQIAKKPAEAEPLGLRYGVIGSVAAGPPPTVGVYISGAPQQTLGLAYLTSYAPTVGDIVVMMKQGGDLWVIGSHDAANEEGGGGGSGSGGGHGPKNGRGLYTNWVFDAGAAGGFYAFDHLIRIEDAPLPGEPDPYYYWAMQYGFIGGGAAYVGLQCNGYPSEPARNQCIWSVWDSVPASVAEFAVVSGSPPGDLAVFAHPFGGEGIGQTINLVNAWERNHEHRMRLYSIGDDGHGDGSQWFRLYFADLTAGWEVQVGKICNAPGTGLIAPNVTHFFEPFGGQKDHANEFAYSSALIHRPIGNPFDATTWPAIAAKSWEWGVSDTWPVGRFEATGGDPWSDVRHEFGLMSL